MVKSTIFIIFSKTLKKERWPTQKRNAFVVKRMCGKKSRGFSTEERYLLHEVQEEKRRRQEKAAAEAAAAQAAAQAAAP